MTGLPCNAVFDGWKLSISWPRYVFLLCLPASLALRVVHSWLRALAVQRGDFPHEQERRGTEIENFWKAFWYCLNGVNKFREHSDLWIPTAIGIAELASYPVLLVLGQYGVIGGWIGIKTAGGWVGWKASRTSFNRFLLFNILTLLVAYFWLSRYIERLQC